MKTSRTNVILPVDLLKEIDVVAGARRRSYFLAQAAGEKLARLRFDRAAARAFGSWTIEDHQDLITDANVRGYLRRVRAVTTRRMRRRLPRG
jgi:hypothetical protein